ncbi:MAG: NADH-quinone oxidoreductase subunit N [Acidobacteria bacterium]|nr:NADH-quinone oxidoreductase subunit N [Acidobacteriota bacterium]
MTLDAAGLLAILPLLIIGAGTMAVMAAIAMKRNHKAAAALSFAAIIVALISAWMPSSVGTRAVTPLLTVDDYSRFFTTVLLVLSAGVILVSFAYLDTTAARREEYYLLLLTGTIGALVLPSASHYVALFLGIELLSIPLYALLAYLPHRERPLEAGLKYLVLAGASSAFLLFGIALLYAETGSMAFGAVAAGQLATPAMVLILVGLGFKLAIVPFHLWTADVYQGAPAPVGAFIATVSKGAVIAVTMRLLFESGALSWTAVRMLLMIMALGSMFAGNVLALMQTNVKRLLAYSSISHLGYVLMGIQIGGALAVRAVAFYVMAYTASVLLAFGVVSALSAGQKEPEELSELEGLFWTRPWMGVMLTLSMMSLAGVPLTVGFMGKYYLLAAGADSSAWLLSIGLVVTSAIGAYYYLRVVVAIYSSPPEPTQAYQRVTWPASFALMLATAVVLWLGVYPRLGLHRLDLAGSLRSAEQRSTATTR